MEVEVKLRLDEQAYMKLLPLLHATYPHLATKHQTNTFFDSPSRELASTRTVFRIRRSAADPPSDIKKDASVDEKVVYTSTIKGKAQLVDGICRVEESEDVIPAAVAESILTTLTLLPSYTKYTSPSYTYHCRYPTIERIMQRIGGDLIQTGTFMNKREVFAMGELHIELDMTRVRLNVEVLLQYEFGVAYELEIESVDPETAKLDM